MLLDILFSFFALLTLVSATLVISASNPIHSVLFLVLVFCSTSALFILIEAEFVAMVFIMVYVGAIAVLFLFVVMMLNVRVVQFNITMLRYLPIGGVIGFIFLLELFLIVDHDLVSLFSIDVSDLSSNTHTWSNYVDAVTNIEAIGRLLYTQYAFLFLVAGAVLLVAMIGAIVLTLHKREGVRRQDIYEQVTRDFMETIHLTTVKK